MTTPLTGSCLCNAIQFEIDQFQPEAAHCHCSMCRKFHGALFATYGSVKKAHFRWVTGKDELKTFSASNGTERSFCERCGSSLVFASPNASSDIIEIALGAVEGDIPLEPDAHIFVGSGSSCTRISDSLPKYIAGRNSELMK